MQIFGHLAAGYLLTYLILKTIHPSLSSADTNLILILGAFFSFIPDIDMIFFYFRQKFTKKVNHEDGHRAEITHTPFFWIIISLIVFC